MNFEEYKAQFHLELTGQQDRAVQAVDGPVLVLAVPGSGKTTVLVARLGYLLLCRGIRPEEILTVTYTVAATRDMRGRFVRMFGESCPGAEKLEFRTINGICARIIAEYGRRIGKEPFALQTDEGEILKLLRKIYIEVERAYPTEAETADLRSRISSIKNRQLKEKDLEKEDREAGYRLSEIFHSYCTAMKKRSQMDYDDQMVYAWNILKRCPELLDEYRKRYRYLCVDEAQDTSRIQHRILNLLAGGGNLFLVGDEDQSIYGFRAACPEALLHFEEDHPGAQILYMEQNFRSDAAIVKAADQLIVHNRLRHANRLLPVREQQTKVRILSVKKREDQYAYLVKLAKECAENPQGKGLAVLYRNNESAVPLIDRLEREQVPYRMRGADLAFFSHRVLYDIIGIYRFLENPARTDLFLSVYYKMSLYLNKKMAEEACREAEAQSVSVWAVLLQNPELPEYVHKAVREVKRHTDRILHGTALTALQLIEGALGYDAYLERMGSGREKLELLEFLAVREPSMEALLQKLQKLQETIREKEYDPACPFVLSTIHGSKGLEYDRVILMDVGDGVFPAMRPYSSASAGGLLYGKGTSARGKQAGRRQTEEDRRQQALYEEERRIFYVGLTRARDELTILQLPQGSSFANELLPAGK